MGGRPSRGPRRLSQLARIGELAGVAARAQVDRQLPHRQADAVLNAVSTHLLEIHLQQLSPINGLQAEYGRGFGLHTLPAPHSPIAGMVHNGALSSVLRSLALPPPGEVFLAAVEMELAEPRPVSIVAGYGVIVEGQCDVVWVDEGTARLRSTALEAIVARLGDGLRQRLPTALAALARSLR